MSDPANRGHAEARSYRRTTGSAVAPSVAYLRAIAELLETTPDPLPDEGRSYEEVAEAMNTSVGTIRSRLYRARARLRAALGRK